MKETFEVIVEEGSWHEAREKAQFYQSEGWELVNMRIDDEMNIRIALEREVTPLEEKHQQKNLTKSP